MPCSDIRKSALSVLFDRWAASPSGLASRFSAPGSICPILPSSAGSFQGICRAARNLGRLVGSRRQDPAAFTLGGGRPEPKLEAAPGFEPGMKVLQTSALPLGYAAPPSTGREPGKGERKIEIPRLIPFVERETGVEPATPTLARWCSTTELFPRTSCVPSIQNSHLVFYPIPAACQGARFFREDRTCPCGSGISPNTRRPFTDDTLTRTSLLFQESPPSKSTGT